MYPDKLIIVMLYIGYWKNGCKDGLRFMVILFPVLPPYGKYIVNTPYIQSCL